MKKYICTVCQYIVEGNEPPEKCEVCGALTEMFEEINNTKED